MSTSMSFDLPTPHQTFDLAMNDDPLLELFKKAMLAKTEVERLE